MDRAGSSFHRPWRGNGKSDPLDAHLTVLSTLRMKESTVRAEWKAVGRRPNARLFTGPRGGRIATAVPRDATHWDEVVTDLDLEYLRRHDLRHTGLTWMADAGVPLHHLRKIAGHGSLTTTQRT